MQDDFTGLLMSYIFSYAIINELCIYYIINFLFFQERGEALGQPTAHCFLLSSAWYLLTFRGSFKVDLHRNPNIEH